VTLTPTPTATRPGKPPLLRLSELLPAPLAVDWDENGTADVNDDWIELVNAGTRSVNLGGWGLDLGAGEPVYRFPRGTVLRAGVHLYLPRKMTQLALIDTGGEVRLRDARGNVVDRVIYPATAPDASYSRDATGAWHTDYPPSPGTRNLPVQPAGTPAASATPATPTVR
jgi:hypothetical protein